MHHIIKKDKLAKYTTHAASILPELYVCLMMCWIDSFLYKNVSYYFKHISTTRFFLLSDILDRHHFWFVYWCVRNAVLPVHAHFSRQQRKMESIYLYCLICLLFIVCVCVTSSSSFSQSIESIHHIKPQNQSKNSQPKQLSTMYSPTSIFTLIRSTNIQPIR